MNALMQNKQIGLISGSEIIWMPTGKEVCQQNCLKIAATLCRAFAHAWSRKNSTELGHFAPQEAVDASNSRKKLRSCS